MYKIFVCATAYDSGKSGISVYINNVLRELAAAHRLEVMAFPGDIKLLPKSENIKYIEVSSWLGMPLINMLWHLFILPLRLARRKYDFVLLPAGNRRLLRRCRFFTIAVVHDLSQYHVEQKYDCFRMFYCKKILPFYLRRVNRALAVSRSTAADLERFWKMPVSRITVDYNGFDRNIFNSSPVDPGPVLKKYAVDRKKYILYLSRVEHPGKNHLNLIKAYETLPAELQAEYDLVLGGSFWPGAEEVKEYAGESAASERIRFIGFVEHGDLKALYQGASLYIFPSLFEGFGLSLVEAMACGVPTACSSTSSLGEIGGDASLLFNPCEVGEICSAMRDILKKPALRKKLVAAGFKRIERFDWKKHAESLVELYEKSGNVLPRRSGLAVRVFESVTALGAVLVFALPLWLYAFVRGIFTGKEMFFREDIYGDNERILNISYFNVGNVILQKASLFYYVFTFRLRLAGVSIRKCGEEKRRAGDCDLFMDCPGIFSLWFLRMSRGIAYSGRLDTELKYVSGRSFAGDLMIILRSVPAILFFNPHKEFTPEINLLDIKFNNINMKEAIAALNADIAAGRRRKVYYVNADCFNKAVKDENYLEILRKGDYILPDGVGVLIACKMLGFGLKENVNGTDMLPFLCRMAVEQDYSVFLFGAKPGVAALMRDRLLEAYPGLRIAGERHGYFECESEEREMLEKIKSLRPDILLVALGAPVQEKWIEKHFDELPCRLMIGVGGLFDFYSGRIKRAPMWVREIGMEWIFRLAMEPGKRFKRYLIGNILFLWRVSRWRKRRGSVKAGKYG
ncbi:MAG: WecB/TagA/CpsF family glycosyltransferase [Victivallaceae bacterium]|nr:WecB/TagA/CpsF family glycosyltransferase [Victivallaceae bacterium]